MYYNRTQINVSATGWQMDPLYDVCIIGAGAAGLMCALRLAERGVKNCVLLERNERVGRKLSVTGNGQGNVSNIRLGAAHYFGSGEETVAAILRRYGEEWLIKQLEELGGLFFADGSGRVYPASRQASSVTDLFRFALEGYGMPLRLGEKALRVEKNDGVFCVHTESNDYFCRRLVLACGGMASPHFGADGSGYALAKMFGHTVTPLSPSLVRLRADPQILRGLKGVRCECVVTLRHFTDKTIDAGATTRGDVLFTDGGISGDAVFRISAFAKTGDELMLDFLPDIGEEEVLRVLRAKAERYPDMRAEDLLRVIVHSAVGKAVLRRCKVAADERAAVISQMLPRLVCFLKNFTVAVTGTDGFANAQVTKGGVDMRELTSVLESKKAQGLYIVGELCDVDGECGGYNLQWAFSSGACAADAVAESLCGSRT